MALRNRDAGAVAVGEAERLPRVGRREVDVHDPLPGPASGSSSGSGGRSWR